MLNDFIAILLGAVHEYVDPSYWQLVDAICAPSFVGIVLILCCVLVVRAFSAGYRAISGK